MKWIRTRITFEAEDPGVAADIIADMFCDLGLQGVIVETGSRDPDLDWAGEAVAAPEKNAVIGFFPDDDRLGQNRLELEKRLSRLRPGLLLEYKIHSSGIEEQDWAESWKQHFHPVRITDRLTVKPTWREYAGGKDEIIIELDPGMAFGTGTHPTTALCLRLMQRHMKPGFRVLDIGTGSGILMVAAAKLGAAEVCGTDCDPVAINVAEQNLRLNSVKESFFSLNTGNLAESVTGTWNLVTANILTSTIVPMIPDIPRLLEGEGIFIASGILASSRKEIKAAIRESGLEILEILREEDWIGVVSIKTMAF
ncbi:MAG: 50S ribosomal protein L11 methyltransferase [Desulfobacteraceae bacterium]|nr:50S ribosomal protein L11 methyltransferase [Desulfobacteraceae bacterium]